MFKRLLFVIAGLLITMSLAFAQVDVNKADQATLDSVKGIGPKISKAIVDERTKNGKFKDWPDLEQRVKGIGNKNSSKLSQAGVTVNGQSKPNAPASKSDKKSAAETTSANADKKSPTLSEADAKSKSTTKSDTADGKSRKSDKSSSAPTGASNPFSAK